MISFDLRCAGGHVFEAWFASGTSFDQQAAAGQLCCPVCASSDVAKAVMAPNVATKGNRGGGPIPDAALRALAAAQSRALSKSEWVGDAFASRARAMHAGDEPEAAIHGRATLGDARAMAEEGVPVAPLPFPVVPPKQVN